MNVKIKRIDKTLPLPKYETKGAVAFDLVTRVTTKIPAHSIERIPSNVTIKIPNGYMLMLKDRSGTAKKKGLIITAGVIDQDFCGDNDEILAQYFNSTSKTVTVERGERLAQGIFIKIDQAQWQEIDKMEKKDRGGFGTTDS
ncbi:MAG: dUTP diphosphatase [Candidatus Berkelbacteria bacterium]|nr:dUTP diphosphatase [Candidatus Berkelbacteria bacterium]